MTVPLRVGGCELIDLRFLRCADTHSSDDVEIGKSKDKKHINCDGNKDETQHSTEHRPVPSSAISILHVLDDWQCKQQKRDDLSTQLKEAIIQTDFAKCAAISQQLDELTKELSSEKHQTMLRLAALRDQLMQAIQQRRFDICLGLKEQIEQLERKLDFKPSIAAKICAEAVKTF